jgi:hypothetical protein
MDVIFQLNSMMEIKVLNNKMPKTNKLIFWTPRILVILFAIFLAIFSLDIFDNCNGFFDCALGLFMHNIPSFILLAILLISWKHELVGAIIFGLIGLAGIIGIIIAMLTIPEGSRFNPIFIIVGVVCTLIGILFYFGYKQKNKKKKK